MKYEIKIPIKATLYGTTEFTKLRKDIRIAINGIKGVSVDGNVKIIDKYKETHDKWGRKYK